MSTEYPRIKHEWTRFLFFRAPEDEKEIFVNLTLDRSRQRKRLSGRKSILRLQDGTRCDTLAAYNPMGLGDYL